MSCRRILAAAYYAVKFNAVDRSARGFCSSRSPRCLSARHRGTRFYNSTAETRGEGCRPGQSRCLICFWPARPVTWAGKMAR
jgi:hypothetical protein